MSERLDELVEATRRRLADRKRRRPLAELELEAAERGECRPFTEALSRPGTSVIAEYKRRSPSAGTIRAGASVEEMVRAYERGGAAALSILTEEDHFGGSLADLEAARALSGPADPAQGLHDRPVPAVRGEGRRRRRGAAGGGRAVGLELGSLYGIARQLELDAIVEVHDEEELDAALARRRRRDRDQQPRPRGLQRGPRRDVRAADRRAGRQDRGVGVGHRRPRADRGARGRGRGRRAGRARR